MAHPHTHKSISFLCTFLLFLCHLQYFCSGTDSIRAGTWIHDGEEIVAASKIFRLGFFTPNGSSGRYVGIWYSNSPGVIVWVAIRDKPIPTGVNGTFGIDAKRGDLEVSDDSGNYSIYFSTYVGPNSKLWIAKLYDTGNLVLTNDRGETLWESFENPTDTFLPGMKMDGNLNLTSWKSKEDPAPGNFSFKLDEETGGGGGYKITKSELITAYWKSGGDSTTSFLPKQMSPSVSTLLTNAVTHRRKAIIPPRLFMQSNGEIEYLSWDFGQKRWLILWSEPKGPCSEFQVCGHSGKCRPEPQNPNTTSCTCFPGFEPINGDDWKAGDFSGGCIKKPSKCTRRLNDTSYVQLNVKMVRSNTPNFNGEISEDMCNLKCLKECNCQAYSYGSNKTNDRNSGCWFWFDNLEDIQEGSDGVPIFFRVDPPSDNDLGSNPPASAVNQPRDNGSSPTNWRIIIIPATVIFAVALLCSLTCIFYRRIVAKRKARNIKENQALQLSDNEDQFGEDDKKDIDVPFFELESIVGATDNFSKAYKLGEGGFGPVYKGMFPGGVEIAVKRLSSNSGQGLKEFKNEVVLIAKLQHRNLVRLLGYCIKGKEKILLYEYMPNKSLDALIFDSNRSMLLNWAARFDIIIGVARGLLYLHQDSRLRIIHRDMKASNILLDDEMNLKISDFGLARIVGRRDTESSTTRVIGTYAAVIWLQNMH
nr:PREDICTED: G-type lectin S-receptor-like serine/threonine-protein kinase At4g03230 isoform X2 [Daucus carota subsp. sativus]